MIFKIKIELHYKYYLEFYLFSKFYVHFIRITTRYLNLENYSYSSPVLNHIVDVLAISLCQINLHQLYCACQSVRLNQALKKRNKPKLIPFSKRKICFLNYSAAGVSSGATGAAAGVSTATGAAGATVSAASAFLATVERRVRAAFLVAFSFNMFSL